MWSGMALLLWLLPYSFCLFWFFLFLTFFSFCQMRQSMSIVAVKRRMKTGKWGNQGQCLHECTRTRTVNNFSQNSFHFSSLIQNRPVLSLVHSQLHHQHPWRVHSEAGLPAPPAGQQGTLWSAAATAARATAEWGIQAFTVSRETETHRRAKGAEEAARGGINHEFWLIIIVIIITLFIQYSTFKNTGL